MIDHQCRAAFGHRPECTVGCRATRRPRVSVRNSAEWIFSAYPERVNAGDFIDPEHVDDGVRPDAVNGLTAIQQPACGHNSFLRTAMPLDEVQRTFSVLNMPCHFICMIGHRTRTDKRVILLMPGDAIARRMFRLGPNRRGLGSRTRLHATEGLRRPRKRVRQGLRHAGREV